MSDNFVGEIRMFGGNFAIRNWAFCNGQLMSIAQNQTLFALIGTTYGGDGVQTFALPDLRGRIPIGQGNAPGLTPRQIGESGGTENVTVLYTQMPLHSHPFFATAADATLPTPAGNALTGKPLGPSAALYAVPDNGTNPAPTPLAPTTVGNDGGNQSHPNIMPSLALSFIIALQGIFPSRN